MNDGCTRLQWQTWRAATTTHGIFDGFSMVFRWFFDGFSMVLISNGVITWLVSFGVRNVAGFEIPACLLQVKRWARAPWFITFPILG